MLRLNARFLAALAALSLPLSLLWLIVLDSKPSRLNPNLAKLMWVMHMEVDKVADIVVNMEGDMVSGEGGIFEDI